MAQISCYGSDLYERILSEDRQTVIGKKLIQKNAPTCLRGSERESYYAAKQAAAEAELRARLEANIVMFTDLAKAKQQYIIDEIKRMTARVNENSITAEGIQIFKDGIAKEIEELAVLNLRLKGICAKLGVPIVQFPAPTIPNFAVTADTPDAIPGGPTQDIIDAEVKPDDGDINAPDTVSRTLPASVALDGIVNVKLDVKIGSSTYYVVDEVIPVGWNVLDNGGASDIGDGHLKWLAIQGANDTTYNYTLQATTTAGTFTGKYMFENTGSVEIAILGDWNINVMEGAAPVEPITPITPFTPDVDSVPVIPPTPIIAPAPPPIPPIPVDNTMVYIVVAGLAYLLIKNI